MTHFQLDSTWLDSALFLFHYNRIPPECGQNCGNCFSEGASHGAAVSLAGKPSLPSYCHHFLHCNTLPSVLWSSPRPPFSWPCLKHLPRNILTRCLSPLGWFLPMRRSSSSTLSSLQMNKIPRYFYSSTWDMTFHPTNNAQSPLSVGGTRRGSPISDPHSSVGLPGIRVTNSSLSTSSISLPGGAQLRTLNLS